MYKVRYYENETLSTIKVYETTAISCSHKNHPHGLTLADIMLKLYFS